VVVQSTAVPTILRGLQEIKQVGEGFQRVIERTLESIQIPRKQNIFQWAGIAQSV
jgi:hypothetical protein